jgi:hypothetical protein
MDVPGRAMVFLPCCDALGTQRNKNMALPGKSAGLTTEPTRPNGREPVVRTPGALAGQASEPGSPTKQDPPPRWRPPFISALAAEDRCHLNGLCLAKGRPAFVTALARPTRPAAGGPTRRAAAFSWRWLREKSSRGACGAQRKRFRDFFAIF